MPGDVLRLPDLGDTLPRIAAEGADVLYRGDLARETAATVAAGGGKLTADDLAAYRVVWRRPVRVALPRARGDLEPAAVLGRHPDRLRARAARARPTAASRDRREALASLAEVMREQTRARAEPFATRLHRGGLAAAAPRRRALAAAVAADRGVAAGPRGAHVRRRHDARLRVDEQGNAASLSSSTGSGSGVIVPGTGIHLNNMLGEYDLVAGAPASSGPPPDEHDGADDRRRCRRPAARRRQRRLGPAARRDHAGDRARRRRRPRRRRGDRLSAPARRRAARPLRRGLRRGGGRPPGGAWATTSSAGGAATSSSAARTRSRSLPGGTLAAAGDARRGGDGVVVA